MTSRPSLERVTDFGDYTRGGELQEFLKQASAQHHNGDSGGGGDSGGSGGGGGNSGGGGGNHRCRSSLPDVRISPDGGRHVHVILRKPNTPSLLTFDRYDRIPAQKQNQKRLELRVTSTSSIVDVVYLDHNNNKNNNNNNHHHHNHHHHNNSSSSGRSADVATLAVVYENGKAEFWRFQEGWRLLQTSDLCNSPRARVVSVAASSSSSCGNLIIWCEERPPSESSPTLSVGSRTTTTTTTRNNFRYCICKRAYEVVVGVGEEGQGQGQAAVTLGGVKIALHNNPCFTVVTSGEYVYLLPAATPPPENPLVVASLSTSQRCLLSWSPQRDTFRVSSTCKGTLLSKKGCPSSPKETDFKRLVTECLGYLSALEPPEIRGFSPVAGGGLLLLLSTGWVTLLQRDGTLRRIYRLPDHNGPSATLLHSSTSFHAYQDTLALARGRSLHLIDLRCGRELHHITLKRDAGAGALLFVNKATERRAAPHLLLETGLYVVRRGRRGWQEDEEEEEEEEEENGWSGGVDRPWSESGGRLVESVFEEACKYYQQRSLSSTQLTVDKLRRGGMFQAPISLATILKDYLRGGGGGGGRQNAGGELSNGGLPGASGDDETGAGQDKLLLGSLEAELKALVSLEEVKGTLVRAGGKEVEAICARLVQQEVCRLLGSSELDASALLYLNSLFSRFPPQAWRATQAALQLHHDASGALVSSGAPPEVWKTVLGPGPPTASLAHTNGQPKPKHLHQQQQQSPPVLLPHHSGPRLPAPSLSPVLLPVFELLCLTLLRFQAAWLPAFLELARQKQGSGALSISLASSSWVGGGGGGGENGERGVPLYKRALAVLHSGQWPERPDHRDCGDQETLLDLEVELLLVSGRPNAVLQALRLLVGRGQWERVTHVAQRFCSQSPLLNREIFGSLLCEVAQHRDLDPYLELLWALCPDDLTVTGILNLVLKAVPAPNLPPPSSSSSCSSSSSSSGPRHPAPFPQRPQPPHSSAELTVGLLKPLLRKVLQRETKPSQHYADILQSPVFPPAPPPRQPGLDPAPERQQKPQVAVVAASQAASSTDFTPWGSDPTPPPPPPEHETLGHHGGVVLPSSPFF